MFCSGLLPAYHGPNVPSRCFSGAALARSPAPEPRPSKATFRTLFSGRKISWTLQSRPVPASDKKNPAEPVPVFISAGAGFGLSKKRVASSARSKGSAVPSVCPCHSGKQYGECCGRFHSSSNLSPPSPVEVMRSRYSAFALNIPEYILRTSHPRNPVFREGPRQTKKDVDRFSRSCEFRTLEILDAPAPAEDAEEAVVTFRVGFRLLDGSDVFQLEKSVFLRGEDGEWLYFDGDVTDEEA